MSIPFVLDPNSSSRLPQKLCALGIMTKAPQAGKVKTRLTPPLKPEEAAQLNICFLRDISRSISLACQQSHARGVGIYDPPGTESAYENILSEDFFLIPQRGSGFGERLAFAAEDLLNIGFESVCLINSDSPTVSMSIFAEAANELAKPGDRIILGPSDDGGYYLIGLKQLHRRLFEKIDWSTERVFEQTKERAVEINILFHQLPFGFDIDNRESLSRLCDELFERDADGNVAVETRRFLSDIIEREGRDRIWPKAK